MNRGLIVHISSRDIEKQTQFVNILGKTLQDQGYPPIELLEQHVRENLASTDNELLARAICWASQLLANNGGLVLVSVSNPLSRVLAGINQYTPAVELTINEEPATSASHSLSITAETMNLPQEIAQVVLLLEARITTNRETSTAKHLVDSNVYSDQEEALLEEHLKALGYL